MDDQDREPWWQRRGTAATLITLCLILVLTLAYVGWRWNIAEGRMELMAKQEALGFLQPPSGTQRLRIDPRSSLEVNLHSAKLPQRFDLIIQMRSNRYDRFNLNLSRADGTAVLYVNRVARDTNGELLLGLNSTLLPNGRYKLLIEGVNSRGQTTPLEKVTLQVSGR